MEVIVSNIGQFCLLFAFCLSCYAMVASFLGGKVGHRRLVDTAERSMVAVCVLVTLTVCTLWYELNVGNFSLQYVASHSNRAMPWYYKIGALWGGQEGSLVFWCWILSIYSLVTVLLNRKKNRTLMPYVVMAISMVSTFFLLLNNFVANPFDLIGVSRAGGPAMPFAPMDGNGLNPALQYWAMVIHPPILYTGYVGFTVPFAFAVAALITRELDEEWIRTTRRWMMVPWLFQGTGILLGAKWAYVVLGWGGYWSWDPVENASLMPWLTGTAFLHSVMMQEKRGMMKVWNVWLVFSTFLLCILGTFMTRSGVVSSVHAFAQSSIGSWFVGFMIVVLGVCTTAFLKNRDYLRSDNQLDSMVSRESSFLFNNLILLVAGVAGFFRFAFPGVLGWIEGTKINVGAPFFKKVNIPIGLFLLFLTGVGPLLAWRKTSFESLKRNFGGPLLGGLVAGGIAFPLGLRNFYSLVCLILSVFVTLTIFSEFFRGARVIHARTGSNFLSSVGQLTMRNTRRYGGYVVHFGMVLIFTGLSGTAFNQDKQQELSLGESMNMGQYRLVLQSFDTRPEKNYTAERAIMEVMKGNQQVMMLYPERRFFPTNEEAGTVGAIYSTLREELYVCYTGRRPQNQKPVIHAYLNPLV